MNANLREAIAVLPEYLSQHVLLSIAALALGVAISLPLAVVAARMRMLRGAVLGFAGLIQTIPALALLALFYPILLALSLLSESVFGFGFRALGFLPALLALTLYSMLPVLRNTITALIGIDPAIRMAAQGVGMTPRQSLWLVELPLAAPVIMAGIRTATVWVIGAATLSTPIGQTSLGNYIFTGLQTENWVLRAQLPWWRTGCWRWRRTGSRGARPGACGWPRWVLPPCCSPACCRDWENRKPAW